MKSLPLIALKTHPVIAAVRDMSRMEKALNSSVNIIFLMCGTLSDVGQFTRSAQDRGKRIFIHIDLLKGIGRDKEAVEFIADEFHPDGIVSTRPQMLQAAASRNLATILQIFMIDSQAFDTGLKNVGSLKPNAVEIMPGLMPRVAAEIKSHTDTPLIAAGLIKQRHEVDAMLAAGCDGVAVSDRSLWNYLPVRP